MRWDIPNILTVFRIILIPVFVVVFFWPEFQDKHVLLTSIFFVAGISDWFDGYLARKLEQQSAFGAFLDPVADKLMVGVAFVCLVSAHPGALMAVPAVIIIGREIAISGLREWMANRGQDGVVAVNMGGKVKTAAQMLSIGFLLYYQDLWHMPVKEIGYSLLYLAAILTLWSMVRYLISAWPTLVSED